MWRSSFPLLKHGVSLSMVSRCSNPTPFRSIRSAFIESNNGLLCGCLFSTSGINGGGGGSASNKTMGSVDVEALKSNLAGNEVVRYSELLQACESIGVAKSPEEAKEVVNGLDDAGVIFIFRDKVSLHPQKVMDLVRRAVPLALMPEDDPQNEELKTLQAKQQEIDVLAQKQVKRILWAGLGLSIAHVSLFFRLTFWEFSWDVMEPITFFSASSGLIVGYAYFLFTSRDPSYQDLMKRLFLSRRRKLIQKHNFNVERLMQLQKKCKSPMDSGMMLETEELLNRNSHK